MSFPVTDVVADSDGRALDVVEQTFGLMEDQIVSVLGPVTGVTQETNLGAWWDLESGGRIRLDSITIGWQMRLLSQRIADVERYEETHDMSPFE